MIKPIAVISQAYYSDGSPAVLERLVFIGVEGEMKSESQATFRLRAVKDGDGNFEGVIRMVKTSFMLQELPFKTKNEHIMMAILVEWLGGCFEVRENKLDFVSDKPKRW